MGAGGAVVCIGEWDVYDLWIGNGGLELHAKRSNLRPIINWNHSRPRHVKDRRLICTLRSTRWILRIIEVLRRYLYLQAYNL